MGTMRPSGYYMIPRLTLEKFEFETPELLSTNSQLCETSFSGRGAWAHIRMERVWIDIDYYFFH